MFTLVKRASPLVLCALGTSATFISGPWSLTQSGDTGVAAMMMAVVSETKVLIYDKVEHNPLTRPDGRLAWAVEYDINTNAVRTLNPITNSFCAGGSHLSNGTFLSTGGNSVDLSGESGSQDGFQGLRFFTPCNDGTCDVYEDPPKFHLTSNRWYPTTARLQDGSVIIFGGSLYGGYINNPDMNNPTYEFYPPKNINGYNGTQIPSPFLGYTLNANLFPYMYTLPMDGLLFIAANTASILFNWKTNTETRLPDFPNGVRCTYPMAGSGTLLPLTPENLWTPTMLLCGGSSVSDTADPMSYSTQTPASDQCVRMTLTPAGIAKGWEVERLPEPRVMGEGVLLLDERVLIVNGAQSGVAGYGNVANQVGQSNADNPAFRPVIYDPRAPAGSRFSTDGLPTSLIPRMYHSVATLVPDGRIMIAGSSPNADVTPNKYATEYRVEWLSPAYMFKPRPSYAGLPGTISYGIPFILSVTLPPGTRSVRVTLMDLGFATHGVHMDQRLVVLPAVLSPDKKKLIVTAPLSSGIYPPGPGYLSVVTEKGVPSVMKKTLVGGGMSPPVHMGAIANLLKLTEHLSARPTRRPTSGEAAPIPTGLRQHRQRRAAAGHKVF